MTKPVAVIISPNWRDYAEKYLADCLRSWRDQDYDGQFKLFLLDNESAAASRRLIKDLAETNYGNDYELITSSTNDGFARANNRAIAAAWAKGCDDVVLINMDTVADRHCLSALTAAATNEVAAAQARLMLFDQRDRVNSLGNQTHFLGFGYCRDYGKIWSDGDKKISDISYPSGAAVWLRGAALRQVGLLDEELWMYAEDQDLGWRLAAAGWRQVLAAEAVVYHHYDFAKTQERFYWLERNRWWVMLKNYHLLTLFLIAPAWLFLEIVLCAVAWKQGWLKAKLRAYAFWLRPATWRHCRFARRQAQSQRRLSEKELTKYFSGRLVYPELDGWLTRLGNPFLAAYWQVAKRLIVW